MSEGVSAELQAINEYLSMREELEDAICAVGHHFDNQEWEQVVRDAQFVVNLADDVERFERHLEFL